MGKERINGYAHITEFEALRSMEFYICTIHQREEISA